MFGAKYNRLTFWIWSVILLLPFSVLATFSKAVEMSSELAQANFGFRALLFIIIIIWMNALANRMRDYGSNPWIAFFSLVPLANIGLALYYGIAKSKDNNKKKEMQDQNNSDISLVKAVYNHTKDISSEVKPAISEYKQKHEISQTQVKNQDIDLVDEDAIYEQVMLEIEEDRKVKSTWAKAFAKSGGDESKAKAMYITIRANEMMQKAIENLKQRLEKEKASEIEEQRLKQEKIVNEYKLQENTNKTIANLSSNDIYTLLQKFIEENNLTLNKRFSEDKAIAYSHDNIDKYIAFVDGNWKITDKFVVEEIAAPSSSSSLIIALAILLFISPILILIVLRAFN